MARDGSALNPTAASLLGFLHHGPMTGWDLVQTAELVIGDFWSLTRSQVYRELAAMAARGLVVEGERGTRAKRPYELTDDGRAAFAAWLQQEPGPETIRFPLLLTVGFGRHLPPELLADFLTRHREVHAARLASYEQLRAEAADADDPPDPYIGATVDFGVLYERAVLDWFDGLPPELTGGNPGPDPSPPA